MVLSIVERLIIKYDRVKYLGGACDGNALTFSQMTDVVYVEGYIKIKPDNLTMRHRWAFDPELKTAYEVAQLESLTNLGVQEVVPWDSIEYYGYEVTVDEISEMKQPPFALLDSDLAPILKKMNDTQKWGPTFGTKRKGPKANPRKTGGRP